jgi:8-oxo-dGTP diphosphatase
MASGPRYVIAEITDADFDPGFVPPKNFHDYHIRTASRGVLINDGKLALLYVGKKKYHKLPGGGVENGENPETAFLREIREETGCDCRLVSGKNQNSLIIEFRDRYQLLQMSYIFFAEIVGKPRELQLTPGETADQFQLQWIPLREAVKLLSEDHPEGYEGKFIQKRDSAVMEFFLKYAGA